MDISDQIIRVLIASVVQIGTGAIILLSILWFSNAISGFTFRAISSTIGVRPLVYTTGWIGTTVHELSHLIVLLIFRIKVVEFKPFSPDFENEHLGYVISEPDPRNPFHWLGFSLSGIAPMFGGIFLLLLSAYLFLPGLALVIAELANMPVDRQTGSLTANLLILESAAFDGIRVLFDPHNLERWQFWVFLYVATCVFCHFSPSRQDMHGIGRGLVSMVGVIVIANSVAACLWFDPVGYTLYWGRYLGVLLGLLGIAFGLGLVYCFITWVVTVPCRAWRLR